MRTFFTPKSVRAQRLGCDGGGVTLSLAAGYAGPLLTGSAPFGPAGRRCSLESAPPPSPPPRTAPRDRRRVLEAVSLLGV
jgi:hypothetical protein